MLEQPCSRFQSGCGEQACGSQNFVSTWHGCCVCVKLVRSVNWGHTLQYLANLKPGSKEHTAWHSCFCYHCCTSGGLDLCPRLARLDGIQFMQQARRHDWTFRSLALSLVFPLLCVCAPAFPFSLPFSLTWHKMLINPPWHNQPTCQTSLVSV